MAYASPIRDVVRGTIWRDRRTAALVIIVGAGNRYVDYLPGGRNAKPVTVWDGEFRKHFEPIFLPAREKRQFSMRLANLCNFHVWWRKDRRKVVARSVARSRDYALNADDAVFVGTYAQPCDPDRFIEDLHDAVRRSYPEAPRLQGV
jgi:hypothetical protein